MPQECEPDNQEIILIVDIDEVSYMHFLATIEGCDSWPHFFTFITEAYQNSVIQWGADLIKDSDPSKAEDEPDDEDDRDMLTPELAEKFVVRICFTLPSEFCQILDDLALKTGKADREEVLVSALEHYYGVIAEKERQALQPRV